MLPTGKALSLHYNHISEYHQKTSQSVCFREHVTLSSVNINHFVSYDLKNMQFPPEK